MAFIAAVFGDPQLARRRVDREVEQQRAHARHLARHGARARVDDEHVLVGERVGDGRRPSCGRSRPPSACRCGARSGRRSAPPAGRRASRARRGRARRRSRTSWKRITVVESPDSNASDVDLRAVRRERERHAASSLTIAMDAPTGASVAGSNACTRSLGRRGRRTRRAARSASARSSRTRRRSARRPRGATASRCPCSRFDDRDVVRALVDDPHLVVARRGDGARLEPDGDLVQPREGAGGGPRRTPTSRPSGTLSASRRCPLGVSASGCTGWLSKFAKSLVGRAGGARGRGRSSAEARRQRRVRDRRVANESLVRAAFS